MEMAGILRISGILGIMLNGQVPKVPDIPSRYYIMLFFQKIRITDCFLFDYADFPCRLITSLPPFHGLPTDTFSAILKSPQKFIPTSSLPKNQRSFLNYAVGRFCRFRVPKVTESLWLFYNHFFCANGFASLSDFYQIHTI